MAANGTPTADAVMRCGVRTNQRRMRRREFITLLGGMVAGWPLVAHAQQNGQTRRIGVLLGGGDNDPQIVEALAAFKAALEGLGWVDGRNVRIDYRFSNADVDRMRLFAKELVALQPDVLVGHTTGSSPR